MQYETQSALTAHRRDVEAGDVHVRTRVNPLLAERAFNIWEEGVDIIQYEGELVSEQDRDQLIDHSVAAVVESGTISHPPTLEDDLMMLRLATEFYETYLFDTQFDKVDIENRYIARLIEALDEKHQHHTPVEAARELFARVHALEVKQQTAQRELVAA